MAKKKSKPLPPSAPCARSRAIARQRGSARRAHDAPKEAAARSPPKNRPGRRHAVRPPGRPADLVSLEPDYRQTPRAGSQERWATRARRTRGRAVSPKLARQLATPEISEHRSTSVRLWAATCVCEVLRIFAPNAPYGDGELLAAFRFRSCFEGRGRRVLSDETATSRPKRDMLSSR